MLLDRSHYAQVRPILIPPIPLLTPSPLTCSDNAAMIAWAGILKLQRQGGMSDPFGPLLRPKWSLEALEERDKREMEEDVPPAEVCVVRA